MIGNSSRNKNKTLCHDNRTDNKEKIFPESIESDEEHTCVNFLQDNEDELPECAGFSMDFESHER